MTNYIMKRVAQLAKERALHIATPHQKQSTANFEHYLSKLPQPSTELLESTKLQYLNIIANLEYTRAALGQPVDIKALAKTPNTFYAYRAAVRWAALTNAPIALKAHAVATSKEAIDSAYATILNAAADLSAYPEDKGLGLSSASYRSAMESLIDPLYSVSIAPKKAKSGKNDKLKDSNTIQKISGWRGLIFARLQAVGSEWLDHAAVAALTGCRPAELTNVRINRSEETLVVAIPGAKVNSNKGQPLRVFTLRQDNSAEFAHLRSRLDVKPTYLKKDIPKGVKLTTFDNGLYNVTLSLKHSSTASAFSEALKRAGKQVLGKKAPTMTGYVYRHALACDMKREGAARETIAKALGHCVTKTQSHYGRAVGGSAGVRNFTVEAERGVKHTHGTGQQYGKDEVAKEKHKEDFSDAGVWDWIGRS